MNRAVLLDRDGVVYMQLPHYHSHKRQSKKLSLIGKDLAERSLDTVEIFYNDACKADYNLQ
jgi:hypothetical protein